MHSTTLVYMDVCIMIWDEDHASLLHYCYTHSNDNVIYLRMHTAG